MIINIIDNSIVIIMEIKSQDTIIIFFNFFKFFLKRHIYI